MNENAILEAIMAEPDAVRIHLATIGVAGLATALILPLRKGTRLHRTAGWIWTVSMMTTCIVSFWIPSSVTSWGIGPIHAFAVLVLWSVPRSIAAIRRGDVEAHRKAMHGVCIGGLGVAGVLTFAPGRLFGDLLFS